MAGDGGTPSPAPPARQRSCCHGPTSVELGYARSCTAERTDTKWGSAREEAHLHHQPLPSAVQLLGAALLNMQTTYVSKEIEVARFERGLCCHGFWRIDG